MNIHICPHCGARIGSASSIACSCGKINRDCSSTPISKIHQDLAPQTVALLNPPAMAEKVLGKLQKTAASGSAPTNKTASNSSPSNSVSDYLNRLCDPPPGKKRVDPEPAAQGQESQAKPPSIATDFFAFAPTPFLTQVKEENGPDLQKKEEVSKQADSELQIETASKTSEALVQRIIEANMSGQIAPRADIFSQEVQAEEKNKGKVKEEILTVTGKGDREFGFDFEKIISILQGGFQSSLFALMALAGIGFIALLLSFRQNMPDHPQTAKTALELSGKYSYLYQDRNQSFGPNSFVLRQAGTKLEGEGVDIGTYSKRPFHLSGKSSKDRFTLLKTYDKRLLSLTPSAGLIYEGEISAEKNGKKLLKGSWYYKTATSTSLKQPWQAESASEPSIWTSGTQSDNRLVNFFWNEKEAPASRFLRILLICIFLGFALLQLSIKFFGMHGLLNHWERENYIPPSIRKKHRALLQELSSGQKKASLPLGERVEKSWFRLFGSGNLYLPAARRRRNPHILIMGAGSKGKTRLLASMALHDIKNADRSVVVVDADGTLSDLLLRSICSEPEAGEILKRVRIIDPCRSDGSTSFNPLLSSNASNLQAVASAIVTGFKSVYTESQNQQNQWSQQTSEILRTSVILLMLNKRNLSDLPLLLSDNDFRDVLLETLERSFATEWKTLIDAWAKHKKLARSEQWLNWIEPILNRVQPLLSDRRIAELLTNEENSIDLGELIQKKQVLIVRVPTGQLEKGGQLLGALIVTGLKQAAYMHYEQRAERISETALYLDEMSSFMDSDAFESICADTRKVSIGIHGTLKTLQNLSEEYRNKVILNFGAMALFAVSKKDAELLGPTMFRVDGRKRSKINLRDVLNPVNSTPQLQYVSDEEKLNINRLVGQEERCYFLHLVGTEAGVFKIKAPEFKDIERGDVNWDLMDRLYESETDSQD